MPSVDCPAILLLLSLTSERGFGFIVLILFIQLIKGSVLNELSVSTLFSSSSITLLSDCNDLGTLCDLIFKIPVISLNSGNDNRDSNMLNYLNAFSYPEVRLSISDFSVREYNEEIIICDMTISGMTQEIQIPLTLLDVSKNEIQYKAESSFTISLNQFNIDIPKLLFIPISPDIKIKIELLIEKKIN